MSSFFCNFKKNYMLDTLKEFASKKIELLKMEATEKAAVSVGTIVFASLIALFFLFFIILLNIGLGLLIGYYLGNYAYGMLIMAGIYLLLIVITILTKKALKTKVANLIIKTINS